MRGEKAGLRSLGLLWLLFFAACGGGTTDSGPSKPQTGSISLQVTLSAGASQLAVDQERVRIEGPTNKTITRTPGATDAITGLAPGTYSVALEGLSAGEVVTFGEKSGASVSAGGNLNVSVTLNSFVPSLQSLPAAVDVGQNLEVRFNQVAGATSYTVEIANNPEFGGLEAFQTTASSVSIPMNSPGTHHVRVRGRNRFESVGQASSALTVTVNPGAGGTHVLTMTKTGQGTVSSAPSGISIGISGDSDTGTYNAGTSVTVTATPENGWQITDWGGACDAVAPAVGQCVVTMTSDQNASVTFGEIPPNTVVVDTLFAVADASVALAYPDINFGIPDPAYQALSNNLAVGADAGTWAVDAVGFAVYSCFLRFDISSIPNGATLESAVLSMRASTKVSASDNRGIGLFTVAMDWSEIGIIWNNQPGVIEPIEAPLAMFGHGDCWTCEFDVTGRVGDWLSGTMSNFGFSLFSPYDAATFQDWTMGFYSRHAAPESLRPMLIVTYSEL